MGLFNRLTNQSRPSSWKADHDPELNPGHNADWHRWHISVHPFTDLLFLYSSGKLGTGQTAIDRMEALFDLSSAESAQVIELYTNYIDDANEGNRALNVMQMQSVLRAVERGIPQQLVPDLKTWLYTEFGITTEDDR